MSPNGNFMKNPKRIDPILKKISELWKLHPDWRLCQLLSNAAKDVSWNQYDLFFLEDDKLLEGLKALKKPC